jgi:hypothetical protein
MTDRTRISERLRTGIEVIDFNRKDKKGRAIGARIYRGVATFVDFVEGDGRLFAFCTNRPAGDYLWYSQQATRNGNIFGPAQPYHYFDTEAEREAAIQKYLKGARKRALNQ